MDANAWQAKTDSDGWLPFLERQRQCQPVSEHMGQACTIPMSVLHPAMGQNTHH